MHRIGLLVALVVLLGLRGRPLRGRPLVWAALSVFGALALLEGRTLELWGLLMGLTAWGADGCSAVVDGLVAALPLVGWPLLALGLWPGGRIGRAR